MLVLPLGARPAPAQDLAAQPTYAPSDEQAPPGRKHVRRAKHVAKRAAVRRNVSVPHPRHRPPSNEPKETLAKAAPLPLPAPKPQAAPSPPPAPEVKQAALSPAEIAPKPPITLGGRNEWRIVTDAATGVAIGLPGRLLPEVRDGAHGTLWSSPHGEIQLETFRYAESGLTLRALFDRMKREPAGRRIESSKLKDDTFVISGMQGLRYFFVRGQEHKGELRGYTLTFDQAMEGIIEPIAPAIAKAFTAFPEHAATSDAPPKIARFGSGVIVDRQGHILTSAGVIESCDALVANGADPAERIAVSDGLALLRASGIDKLAPMAIAPAENAGTLTLAGVPDPREQKGGAATRFLPVRLAGAAIELVRPKPLAGFAGAAALDAQGQLAGLVETSGMRFAGADTTGSVAPTLHLIGIKTIRAFLSEHGIDADAQSGERRSGIVRVICLRK